MNAGWRCGVTAGLIGLTGGAGEARALDPESFMLVAQDFVDGLAFIDGTVAPAIDDTGRVAFVGTQLGSGLPGPQAIFHGNGGPLTAIPTAGQYSGIDVVQIAGNDIAFTALRPFDDLDPETPIDDFYGVYTTNLAGAGPATLFEAINDPFPLPGSDPAPRPYLRMSGNGNLTFSNIVNGDGAVYAGTASGVTPMKTGSGAFFNTRGVDINNSGTVAVDIEYSDPNAGLQRGFLVFDTPEEGLADIESTVERNFFLARFALSDTGQMAMSLPSDITIDYFDTPTTTSPNPSIGSLTLEAGIYLATPNGFGVELEDFEQIASYADGYTSFGDVDVNAEGTVVFEAGYNGESGIFTGDDPITDVIAITGQDILIDGETNFFSIVSLGQLNNAGQLVIQTSDFITTDQKIWIINDVTAAPIPEPSTWLLVTLGALGTLARAHPRRLTT